MASTLDPQRRAALHGAQLVALIGDAARVPRADPVALGADVAVMDDDGWAWVLAADAVPATMGAALAFGVRQNAIAVVLVAASGAGHVARRATRMSMPVIARHLEGRITVDALPIPLREPTVAAPAHRAFVPQIALSGASPIEEHGVVAGEVAGLEVCRVVDDSTTGKARLDIGIGVNDREMFQMLHAERPTVDALADVVALVAAERRSGAARHPFNQLAASRFLRHRVLEVPGDIGLSSLRPVEPPIPRRNVGDEVPCFAYDDSTATVVVFAAGVDLGAVAHACDAIESTAADRCIIAVNERDALPVQHRLAAMVSTPTTVVPVSAQVRP